MTRDFDLLWDFDKPAETEAKFRALLPDQPDNYARWELLTQIARCQGLRREFDEALATLDSVDAEIDSDPARFSIGKAVEEGLRLRASGETDAAYAKFLEAGRLGSERTEQFETLARVKVRSLLERGRVLNSSERRQEGQPLFLRAYNLACEIGEDFFAVDAAHMVAITESPERAMEWNLKGVALAEASEDERAKGWLGSLYNNIGWTLHDQDDCHEALAMFQKALECRVRQQKREPILIARWCIARCLRSLGRVEEALQIQRDLLSSREMDQEQDGYVSEELGECLLVLGKEQEAAPHFQRAYELLSKDLWLPTSDPGRLERIRRLGAGCIEKSTEG